MSIGQCTSQKWWDKEFVSKLGNLKEDDCPSEMVPILVSPSLGEAGRNFALKSLYDEAKEHALKKRKVSLLNQVHKASKKKKKEEDKQVATPPPTPEDRVRFHGLNGDVSACIIELEQIKSKDLPAEKKQHELAFLALSAIERLSEGGNIQEAYQFFKYLTRPDWRTMGGMHICSGLIRARKRLDANGFAQKRGDQFYFLFQYAFLPYPDLSILPADTKRYAVELARACPAPFLLEAKRQLIASGFDQALDYLERFNMDNVKAHIGFWVGVLIKEHAQLKWQFRDELFYTLFHSGDLSSVHKEQMASFYAKEEIWHYFNSLFESLDPTKQDQVLEQMAIDAAKEGSSAKCIAYAKSSKIPFEIFIKVIKNFGGYKQ
ncbi:MAG: hypothetical protein S4CHLAM102_15080 [Chlamydiia bacterium]|nr:hypothetical protein [Chlamydiia bacterium]